MASTDLLDVTEARAYLSGLGGVGAQARLEALVSAVSARIDDLCGPMVRRTVTERHRKPVGELRLHQRPVVSLTSVSETTPQGVTTVLAPATGYYVDSHVLERATWSWYGDVTVEVVYVAGRYADTASVDPAVKAVAGRWLQHLWRSAEGGGSETFAPLGLSGVEVPNEVTSMLAPWRRPEGQVA